MSLFLAWIERLLPALTVTAAVLSAAAMTAYLLWNLRRKRDAEVESQKDPYEPGAREEVRRRWAPIFPIVRLAGVTAALAVAGTLALFLGSVDHRSGPGGVAPPPNAGPDVSQLKDELQKIRVAIESGTRTSPGTVQVSAPTSPTPPPPPAPLSGHSLEWILIVGLALLVIARGPSPGSRSEGPGSAFLRWAPITVSILGLMFTVGSFIYEDFFAERPDPPPPPVVSLSCPSGDANEHVLIKFQEGERGNHGGGDAGGKGSTLVSLGIVGPFVSSSDELEPGHELAQQICAIRAKISELHVRSVVIVGRHDRRPLSDAKRAEVGDNTGLAQRRADKVVTELLSKQTWCAAPAALRTVAIIGGPRIVAVAGLPAVVEAAMASDRQAEVFGLVTQDDTAEGKQNVEGPPGPVGPQVKTDYTSTP